ncbi:hypothetical protein C3486_28640 [Streptomyces sp. Ru73]|uniref:hypothetical protein n=1 Tax=Streptomyces sp. Ru73 TaxID=2080748 RepID=UPI000CDE0AB3|nr:hypothetical protein [Streptomyces sp. Ru73]POX37382.1 hypothetical protein C3486_28640 [Streptomyces sp. Ru73]
MAGGTKLTDAQLAKLEKDLVQRFENIKTHVRKLNTAIDSVEGRWKGIGAGGFNTTQTDLNNRLNSMGKQLAGFVEAIQATRKLSGNTDHAVEQAIKKQANVVDGGGVGPGGQIPSKLSMF